MATKKELIGCITAFLREHTEKEVVIKNIMQLRNGRWGLKPYCITCLNNEIYVRPFAGANVYWLARLERLDKFQLQDILGRCFMSINPKY